MPDSAVAAIDLGSNSFHLVVAQLIDGEVHVIDKLKERVQLAAGLDDAHRLSEAAQMRALACLQRFGQRLVTLPPEKIRVVGTNTLRRAVNGSTFRALGEAALGCPIEIISGHEEARLIYMGVTHGKDDGGKPRLVVDIGGGSTECIVGTGAEIARADSLQMGCVAWSRRFFPDGIITRDALDQAIIAARLELGAVHRLYRSLDWEIAHGSSGTINAVRTVLHDSGWDREAITPAGLDLFEQALVEAGHVDALDMPGLRADRRIVMPGGYAVLRAVFKSFKIKEMHAAKGALREGVLYDLVGRATATDVRDATVQRLVTRFGVDAEQADRVRAMAKTLLSAAAGPWGLDKKRARRFLGWAAALHEVGRVVAYSGYHKHGAYLIQHTEMPGFSYRDHALLAAMIYCHRRKIDAGRVRDQGCLEEGLALRLAALLRLAVRLNRTRNPKPIPKFAVRATADGIHLSFDATWLATRPLTRADLEAEARQLRGAGIILTWD